MPKPLLIIGSSKESLNLARGLQASLGDTVDVELWSQMIGGLSEQILDSFENRLARADFAAFIFAPDDDLTVRDEKTKTVRDNVLLELGVARGMLGSTRAFIVRPSNAPGEIRTATDLLGIIAAEYDATDAKGSAEDIKRALLSCANKIRESAVLLGFREGIVPEPSRRVKGVLPRGGTESLAEQADAAIYVADKRGKYFEELQGFVTGKNVVPSKYLYWTPQGSAHWLQFCELEQYKFYSDSVKVLEQHAETVAQEIINAVGSAELDFISIGSGDGIKDNLILRHLHGKLHKDEYIYYYPVDISDMLIIEAVRNALSKGVPKEQFRVKALIADFVRLEKLQAFYEERPSPNVFSVLGNTVGNADERNLMKALADAMLPGDLVLMEVNAGEPDVSDPVWGDLVTREHDFTPLTVFNVPFNPDLIEYKSIKRESAVAGTQSILASYKEADIDGDTAKGIKLSIVHYYNHKNFLSYMARTLNVKVLWSTPEPDKGVYLALAMREKAKATG